MLAADEHDKQFCFAAQSIAIEKPYHIKLICQWAIYQIYLTQKSFEYHVLDYF